MEASLKCEEKYVPALPVSEGYLLFDHKKCSGCMTCMLICSLVHKGEVNISLSRIQVAQNPFAVFPDDLAIFQCRQCVEPKCLAACPTGALHINPEAGNVRMVNSAKCTGCGECRNACPYKSRRVTLNHFDGKAQKYDLCASASFWDEKGRPGGKPACVAICTMSALKFVKDVPTQEGESGYRINLRGESWKKLGFSADD